MQHFLKSNFIIPPTIIDNDRSKRGDYFKKPTAYWFWHCEPTEGHTYHQNNNVKRVIDCKPVIGGGICSEERSSISPDYARNFILDFILGNETKQQTTLF